MLNYFCLTTARRPLFAAILILAFVSHVIGCEKKSTKPDKTIIVTTGLLAYYPFSGNAADGSGNGHHGTVHGAKLTGDRFGNTRSAYLFDGDDYITVPLVPALKTDVISISVWIRVTELGWDWIDILCYGDHGHVLAVEETGFFLGGLQYTSSYTCEFVGLTDLMSGGWHFLTMTRNADNVIRLYVDGVLERTQTCSESPSYASDYIFIGVDCVGGSEFFRGKIDEIRIYDRTLSEEEIRTLYREEGF